MTNKGNGKGGNGGRVQFNVTIRTGTNADDVRKTTVYLDVDPLLFSRADSFYEVFSAGLLMPAVGVNNAVWYPPHAIVKVEFMETAPEKPRDDRYEDY